MLYKCKVVITMITSRLNVIQTGLQEIRKFSNSHWNGQSKVSFPILTSPFCPRGTAEGRKEVGEKMRG